MTSDSPVFYAWPASFSLKHDKLTDLLEYRHPTESVLIYATERMAGGLEASKWNFGGRVARVWKSPRMDPPTDVSARPVREWTSTIQLTTASGNGTDGGGGCLIERSGLPAPGLEALRGARDRFLPTTFGRWITGVYYAF